MGAETGGGEDGWAAEEEASAETTCRSIDSELIPVLAL